MFKFARFCVRVDLTRPLPGNIKIGETWQRVEYEGLDMVCSLYRHYGHLKHNCLDQLLTSATINASWGQATTSNELVNSAGHRRFADHTSTTLAIWLGDDQKIHILSYLNQSSNFTTLLTPPHPYKKKRKIKNKANDIHSHSWLCLLSWSFEPILNKIKMKWQNHPQGKLFEPILFEPIWLHLLKKGNPLHVSLDYLWTGNREKEYTC